MPNYIPLIEILIVVALGAYGYVLISKEQDRAIAILRAKRAAPLKEA